MAHKWQRVPYVDSVRRVRSITHCPAHGRSSSLSMIEQTQVVRWQWLLACRGWGGPGVGVGVPGVGGGCLRVVGVGCSCCLVLLSVCVLLAGQCAHGCGPQADATRDTCPAPSPRKRFSPPEPRSAGTGTTLRATAYLARVPAFLAPAGDRPAFGSRFPAEVGVRCANQRGVLRRLELLTSRARM